MKAFDRILLASPLQWAKAIAILGLVVTAIAVAHTLGIWRPWDRNSLMAALVTAGCFSIVFGIGVGTMLAIHFLEKRNWFAGYDTEAWREIKNHLTPKEKKDLDRQSAIAGIWAGLFGGGFALGIYSLVEPVFPHSRIVFLVVGVVLFLLGLIGAKKCRRRMKAFILSTEWASTQSRSWDDL